MYLINIIVIKVFLCCAREFFTAMHVIYYVVAYTFVSRNSAFMLAFCSATWFYSKHETVVASTLKHGCTYLEEISVRRVLVCFVVKRPLYNF